MAAIARDYLAIPAASVGVERLFNMARDICSYRRHHLKPDTIRALVITMCTDQYLLREELRIIEASNSAEEETLPENINDDELRDLEIEGLISDNEEDSDLDEDADSDQSDDDGDDNMSSAEFPLPQIQVQPERPMGIRQRQDELFERVQRRLSKR